VRYELILDPNAREDLKEIFDYILERAGARAAAGFVTKLYDHCLTLRDVPEKGTRRDDLRPGLRTLGYRRRATILFHVDHSHRTVIILGVYYGGRDFEHKSDVDES
jgi:toxin ParE1/3/4